MGSGGYHLYSNESYLLNTFYFVEVEPVKSNKKIISAGIQIVNWSNSTFT